MIFLKEFLLNFRMNFFLKKEKIERKAISYEKATHIGLLIHSSNLKDANAINEFVSQLLKDGKKVTAISFTPTKKTIHFEFPCFYLSWDDADWKGDFRREIIHTFIKTPFDYLYSINISPILPFNYLLKKAHARCRIGIYQEGAPLDLMIRIPNDQDLSFLLEQMIKYSQKITTGDVS